MRRALPQPGEATDALPVRRVTASVDSVDDEAWFRRTLSRFASGVTVVTAMADGRPVGMTCQAFASVSLSPPLVLFCPGRSLRVWPLIRDAGTFAVNFLTHQQAGVAAWLGRSNPRKFEEIAWSASGVSGAPLLDESLGYVECVIQDIHEAGDHFVVIGRVVGMAVSESTAALTFFDGRYGTTEPLGSRDVDV